MTSPVETVQPSMPAQLAWERMKQAEIHHLVVMAAGQIVGIVSGRDLGGSELAANVRNGRCVEELMTTKIVQIDEDATLRQAANRLRGHGIGSLLVTRAGKLVGIVTISDLLEALGRGATRPAEQAQRWTLKGRGPRRRSAPPPRA